MNRRLGALPGLLLVGLAPTLALQWLSSDAPDAALAAAAEVARGQDLYVQSCATCHGPTGAGSEQGPPLVGVGAASVDFMLSTGRMPLADPDDRPVRSEPAFSPSDVAALVAYVTSLGPGGPAIPTVDPKAGNLARGREVYVADCLACHGAGAQGASVGGGSVAPPLDRATSVQVAEAVRVGPGVMPRFGRASIGREELDSLVAYILSIRTGQDRGGLGLGHVGPVAEGFVGVVVGLGLLLLVIRFAGTKT